MYRHISIYNFAWSCDDLFTNTQECPHLYEDRKINLLEKYDTYIGIEGTG